jgi:multimeric flavodoxin WrbA
MNPLMILGSSRPHGDTAKLVQEIARQTQWDVIDLREYEISYYDYHHLNREDDFLPLMRQILDQYDTFLFATPVYWYAMSGIMKVFFDRITDLLTIEKELGRRLRGKNMAAISCSNGNNLEEYFWMPFRESAHYLGMNYLGDAHFYSEELDHSQDKIRQFIDQISTPKT